MQWHRQIQGIKENLLQSVVEEISQLLLRWTEQAEMAYYEAGSGHLLLHLNEDNHHTYVDCNSIFQRRAKAK
jgi:hypothetical protein